MLDDVPRIDHYKKKFYIALCVEKSFKLKKRSNQSSNGWKTLTSYNDSDVLTYFKRSLISEVCVNNATKCDVYRKKNKCGRAELLIMALLVRFLPYFHSE